MTDLLPEDHEASVIIDDDSVTAKCTCGWTLADCEDDTEANRSIEQHFVMVYGASYQDEVYR